jgi:hypothetical protein
MNEFACFGAQEYSPRLGTGSEQMGLTISGTPKRDAPVFIVGCIRSGTTLLYHMLLSAGGFAVYRSESNVFNLLEPRFGDLSISRNRERLMKAWLDSKLFAVSGLDAEQIRAKVLAEASNGGNFLRIVMGEIARKQGMHRWADCTPDHLAYLPRIKETIPDALIIHIIRDPRDVALSSEKQRFIRPLPWDRTPPTMVAGLYWEWIVSRGRKDSHQLGKDYIEVRFEDLVADPSAVLGKIGVFIDQEIDHQRILNVGIGSVSHPNTSFHESTEGTVFSPVGRWRSKFPPNELIAFESLVGGSMEALGYPLATADRTLLERADLRRMRTLYHWYFDSKFYLRAKTPLGPWFVTHDLSWL